MKSKFLQPVRVSQRIIFACAVTVCLSVSGVVRAQTPLSLNSAIAKARANDPWLHGNALQQRATLARSLGARVWPAPEVSLAVLNMPTDSWRFEQENMTQLRMGVTQMIPRGDSLTIRQQQLQLQSYRYPLLQQDRIARITATVSQLWLDAFLAQNTIALINRDRGLFEQMADVAQANYSSAIATTRQQDVIRGQLELIQLEDRLMTEQQRYEVALAQLHRWLSDEGPEFISDKGVTTSDAALTADTFMPFEKPVLPASLPDIPLTGPAADLPSAFERQNLAQILLNHPAVQAVGINYQVARKNVELAKQHYKPQWGVNASYAYRAQSPVHEERADFFSVGVSVDVPLLSNKRTDSEVSASVAESEAVKTEQLLLVKKMLSEVEQERHSLALLQQRQSLYQQELLSQAHEQAEAALTAYTNDDGDFAEVVRARIAELNIRIAALTIDVDTLKTIARLNYYFVPALADTAVAMGDK